VPAFSLDRRFQRNQRFISQQFSFYNKRHRFRWRIVTNTAPDFRLFVNGLELLIDYFAGVAIYRDMQPIAFLSFDHEWLREVRRSRRIASRLGDQINEQPPSPCLGNLGKRTRDCFSRFFARRERCVGDGAA
jgi:hypothetical protein